MEVQLINADHEVSFHGEVDCVRLVNEKSYGTAPDYEVLLGEECSILYINPANVAAFRISSTEDE